MKKGFRALIAEANGQIETMSVAEARTRLDSDDVVFVDLREANELAKDGKIPGATHAPRGMLEFYIDPDSPYHLPVFSSGKSLLFYCASGGRSALAAQTAKTMGLSSVAHLAGGFKAWKEASAPTEAVEP